MMGSRVSNVKMDSIRKEMTELKPMLENRFLILSTEFGAISIGIKHIITRDPSEFNASRMNTRAEIADLIFQAWLLNKALGFDDDVFDLWMLGKQKYDEKRREYCSLGRDFI